jgi:putative ABC transport system permease protein
MDAIFGIPATSIMVVLVAMFAVCMVTGIWVLLRQRVVFKLGVRNIPRRPAQTILIVVGLMLSTLIIAAAFTTGDTLNASIRGEVLTIIGHTDERVMPSAGEADTDTGPPTGALLPESVMADLDARVAGNPAIEGLMPYLAERVPAINERTGLSEPVLTLTGLDAVRVAMFGGVRATDGSLIDLGGLPDNGIVLSAKAADKLDAVTGDTLTVFANNAPHQLTVVAIGRDSLLTGYRAPGSSGGFVMPLARAQALLGYTGQISSVEVTNPGGVEDGVRHSEAATAALNDALAGTPYRAIPVKENDLAAAEETGNVFLTLFLVFGLFSIAVGILLIFLIFVMLAAERKPEMGISRAVGMKRRHLLQQFLAEGLTYDLLAALVGALLGVGVAFVMVRFIGKLVGDAFAITPSVSWTSLIIAYTLGVIVTFLTIVVSAWRVSKLNIVQAIRDIPEPTLARAGRRWLVWGALSVVAGILLAWAGGSSGQDFPLMLGLTMIPFGVAAMLRRAGVPARLLYSLAAGAVLFLWLMPADLSARIFPKTTGGIEMFFVSGIALVASATVLIVWNADLVTNLVGLLGRTFSRWLPAVKTAVAYPLERKGRTGMTIAMFSLVIFSLVMMATIMATADRLIYGSEDASAGWDIQAAQALTNPIADLRATLAEAGIDVGDIAATGRLEMVPAQRSQVRLPGAARWETYSVGGADAGFLNDSRLPLQARAVGYDSDEAVLAAVRDNPGLAIIDNNALESGGNLTFGGNQFVLPGIGTDQRVFDPVQVELGEPLTGHVGTVTIVGIIDTKVVTFPGIYVSQRTFESVYSNPASIGYLEHTVRVAPAVDAEALAKQIESALLPYGVQTTTYQEIIDTWSRYSTGFLRLIEGFMLLGLVVGVAALGVIAFRSVVERRQQIGMLRAIGYQRAMISASFLIEASMLTILGTLSGTALALVLSRKLIGSDYFIGSGDSVEFVIPFNEIGLFLLISLAAALLMAWIPARRAARVPIAEALRYE